ncbi:MAG: proline--tRNA ligase [Gammaproteobacteria bacterium]|nr:proline--tRNA ligase [Gammaproteobacteria bacterium]
MKFSNSLIPTLRDIPANAEIASHILLLRGGFIRQLGSGLYIWLPLGVRVLQKVERIVRDELNKKDAQEVLMPFVQPGELWKESQRWEIMGPDLLRMQDRHENDYCLSPTHEEVITDLFRKNVKSYRQLPLNLYQIATKFRDEIRPRFGVLRSREFIMKDGYSFHLNEDSLHKTYIAMHEAYSAIFTRLALDFRSVEAHGGVIGDEENREFHVLADTGEDSIAYSAASSYAANLEKAEAVAPRETAPASETLTKVSTPNVRTINGLVECLDVPIERTVKTLIVQGEDSPIGLVLRGDHELHEIKAASLPNVLSPLTFTKESDVRHHVGCNVGSIGPVQLQIPYYVDRSAAVLSDFVCGANEDDFHLTGVNWNRDESFRNSAVQDLRKVVEGDPAPDGSGPLSILRGIEVGHIFKLGKKYSHTMNATVLDEQGESVNVLMGCYGLGITRLAAAVIEQKHDDVGPLWPIEIAPAQVHLVALNVSQSSAVASAATQVYEQLTTQGIEVLYDDRNERPGVKFADADLIGIPYRITIGERGLKHDAIEYQHQREVKIELPLDQVVSTVLRDLN